jgi:hypothetical protein
MINLKEQLIKKLYHNLYIKNKYNNLNHNYNPLISSNHKNNINIKYYFIKKQIP